MKTKKLYKSVLKVEVLSEEPMGECSISLSDLDYQITEGECSGKIEWESIDAEVVGAEAVKECDEHGTDPSFFQMDEEGNELEEDF